METGKPLPPIDLFQIKDEYFILDGNHRVAAAKEFGFKDVQARIVECIPQKKTWENILYNEQTHFYEATVLPHSLRITEVGQYPYMIKQVEAHRDFLKRETGTSLSFHNLKNEAISKIVNSISFDFLVEVPARTIVCTLFILTYQNSFPKAYFY